MNHDGHANAYIYAVIDVKLLMNSYLHIHLYMYIYDIVMDCLKVNQQNRTDGVCFSLGRWL
jgi:hypothetical protein